MPYRRRRKGHRRKASKRDRYLMKFRTGNIAPAGGRPFTPNSKGYNCVTADQIAVSATTAGDTGCYDLTAYNQPANLITTTSFTGGSTERHPSGHSTVRAQGYDTARVNSGYYKFDVRFIGTSAVDKDFIFAYKFSQSSTVAAVFTAGAATIEVWNDMRATKGWVWKRFSGTESGGSVHPSQGTVNVRIKSVPKLVFALNKTDTAALTVHNLQTTIDDLDVTDTADVRAFLHIAVFTIDGTAFGVRDVVIDVTVYKNVTVFRAEAGPEMIDEGDEGTG